MARPIIKLTKPTTKRKRGQPAKSASKQVRNWVFRCLWHLNNSLAILTNNNSKLNKVGLSKILNLEFSFLSTAPENKQKKIHYSPSQIDSGPFFVKSLFIALIFFFKIFY